MQTAIEPNFHKFPKQLRLIFLYSRILEVKRSQGFHKWVAVPPPVINILTHPESIVIRQGEKKIGPTEIETPLSSNVTSIAFEYGTNFSSNGLSVSVQRIQPPLFEVRSLHNHQWVCSCTF